MRRQTTIKVQVQRAAPGHLRQRPQPPQPTTMAELMLWAVRRGIVQPPAEHRPKNPAWNAETCGFDAMRYVEVV